MDEETSKQLLPLQWDAFDCYLAEMASTDEAASARARLDRHPGIEADLHQVTTFLVNPDMAALNAPPSWEAMQARIATYGEQTTKSSSQVKATPAAIQRTGVKRSFLSPRHRSWGYGFGAFLVVIGIVIGSQLFRNSQPVLVASRTYQTAPGQYATLQYDGLATMTLAPATTVEVTPETVTVDGEAYFEVQPQSNRPFVVTTQHAVVQVLGTTFSVRHYTGDQRSRVVVVDGKVGVQTKQAQRDTRHQVILTGQMLGMVTDSSVTVTPDISVNNYIGWMHGRLVFSTVPLQDVVAELTRAYGVPIRIADTLLAKQRVTLRAAVDEQSVTQILEFIGRVSNAHFAHTDSGFVLVPGRRVNRDSQDKSIPQPERVYGR